MKFEMTQCIWLQLLTGVATSTAFMLTQSPPLQSQTERFHRGLTFGLNPERNTHKSIRTSTELLYAPLSDVHEDADWRRFRAKLVLKENGIEIAKGVQSHQWAYEHNLLEAGTLLVHNLVDVNDRNSILTRPYLYKSVTLVVESNPQQTIGLVLNRLANVSLHEKGFIATLFYGGSHDSFHHEHQRVFCLHRQSSCADVSEEVMSGLFLCSLQDAKRLHADGRAKPSDFIYISGFEVFDTKQMQQSIADGSWKSITTDAMTLQQGLHSDLDLHDTLLHMIGHELPSSTDTFSIIANDTPPTTMEDALLHEWTQMALCHGGGAPDPTMGVHVLDAPHDIQPGDLLRASSLDHAFLFDHQEFHKAMILILETNHDTAVGALLSYPTVEMAFQSNNHKNDNDNMLPVRHGGSDSDALYVLHFLGDAVGGKKIGATFYQCTMEEAAIALESRTALPEDLLVVRGKVVFPKIGAALDWVSPDKAPEVWEFLSEQEALNPLVLDHNIEMAREAWRAAGGNDGDRIDLNNLGKEAVKAWLSSHLLYKDDTSSRP